MTLVEKAIQNTVKGPAEYQKAIPEQVETKREARIYANSLGTASKYYKYSFDGQQQTRGKTNSKTPPIKMLFLRRLVY